MQSLEQICALRAYETAESIAQADRDEFLTLARGLPAMLQNNGLLAAWAFLLSGKKNAHVALLNSMLQHFKDDNLALVENEDAITPRTVFVDDWIRENQNPADNPLRNGSRLMQLTREALVFSGWIKRAAEAICDQ